MIFESFRLDIVFELYVNAQPSEGFWANRNITGFLKNDFLEKNYLTFLYRDIENFLYKTKSNYGEQLKIQLDFNLTQQGM